MMRALLSRIVGLFGRSRRDAALDDEVRTHLELLAADYERRGLSPEEARFAARRAFGGVEPMKERYRDGGGLPWLDDVTRDVRYAIRSLSRSPGFTIVAVLSLGLGIGASAAIFGLLDAVLLRPLPVRAPEELVVIAARRPGETRSPGRAFSYDLYQRFRARAVVADIAASAPLRLSVDAGGVEEPSVQGQLVSGNYYAMLGVMPAFGRLLAPDDEAVGRDVAVLSHAYFQRRFGGDPAIVGTTVRLNGQPVTVIGISAAGFTGTRPAAPADITMPVSSQTRVMPQVDSSWLRDPYQFWLELVGRLDPRVSEPQVVAALDAVFQARLEELRREGRVGPPGVELGFEPGAQGMPDARTRYARALAVLMGVVLLLLVAACANVANLMLARALKRRGEIALRQSLGASRTRIARQLLAETALIAMAAGATGLALAAWTTGLLRVLLEGEPLQHAVGQPDVRVLMFTAAASLVTAVAFGVAPLLLMSRVEPLRALREQASRSAAGRLFGQQFLVSAQVAISLVLLVGAGLFVRTLTNLRTTDLGFDQEQVLVLRLEPEGSNQKRERDGTFKVSLLRTYGDLLERVESLPSVRSATLAGVTPLGDENALAPRVRRVGVAARDDDPEIRMIQVYPKYFSTMGIRIVVGRDLSPAENAPSASDVAVRAAVINQTMAAQLFGRERDALGSRFLAGTVSGVFEIVGVAEDVRDLGPRGQVAPTAYATYAQAPTGRGQMTLFVRAAGDVGAIASAVRSVAKAVDPTLPLLEVQSLADRVAGSINQERVVALAAVVFSGVAVLLVAVGLYGVAAYTISCREREFGVRLALGATNRAIVALVYRNSVVLVSLGTVAGLMGAAAASRLAASRLFGVGPWDPGATVSAVLILVTVAFVATLVPARRVSRIQPLSALGGE